MLKLKDLLTVCKPDNIRIGRCIISHGSGYPGQHEQFQEYLNNHLDFEVKEITGWDDGLTVELFTGSSPHEHLPVGRHKKEEVKA